MRSTLKERTRPDPSMEKLDPNSFKKVGIYVFCVGVLAILGWTLAGLLYMAIKNQPVQTFGSNEIVFEPSGHDLVTVLGDNITGEISSRYSFSLIKDGKILPSTKTHLARVSQTTGHTDDYVITGPLESGKYQITASKYDMSDGGIMFVLNGTGGLSATMTRSQYDLNFGIEYLWGMQYMGGLAGAFCGFVIAVIILSNLPVQKRK